MTRKPVVVTTIHKGVFFGYLVDRTDTTVRLERARNCLYWSKEVKGFLGLAYTGPNSACRIGPPATIELMNVTCIADASNAAVVAWEKAPWSN